MKEEKDLGVKVQDDLSPEKDICIYQWMKVYNNLTEPGHERVTGAHQEAGREVHDP